MKITAIIAEDEKLAQEKLSDLLQPHQDFIEIIDVADNGIEAVAKINSLKPDLVFLDIQMPGKDGFSVLKEIDQQVNPVIVFTTAYDQYALEAFENNTVDYLLKPITPERLEKTIQKLENFVSYKNNNDQKISSLLKYLENGQIAKIPMKKFKVRFNDEIIFIDCDKISYLKAEGKYCYAFDSKRKYLLNESISFLEKNLPENFVRVHRSYILNTKCLIKLKKWFTGQYKAIIDENESIEIPVGRSYKDRIMQL